MIKTKQNKIITSNMGMRPAVRKELSVHTKCSFGDWASYRDGSCTVYVLQLSAILRCLFYNGAIESKSAESASRWREHYFCVGSVTGWERRTVSERERDRERKRERERESDVILSSTGERQDSVSPSSGGRAKRPALSDYNGSFGYQTLWSPETVTSPCCLPPIPVNIH